MYTTTVAFLLVLLPIVSSSTSVCLYNHEICLDRCSMAFNVSITQEIEINHKDDIRIQFCSPTIIFDEVVVRLNYVNDLWIGSTSGLTKMVGKGASGFHLLNVRNVSIVAIELIKVGMAFKFNHSQDIVFAAMLFESSTDVTLDRVSFIYSNGSGLILLNVAGNSKLTDCSFRNSTYSQEFEKIEAIILTGALHVQLSFCGWNSLKMLGKQLAKKCINNASIQNSSLAISGCNFTGNMMKGKVRGGGLFIFILQGSSGNNISIVDCNFLNNSARLGGGAYIRMQQNVSKNTVTFINVLLHLNWSWRSGGGLSIGYAFDKKYIPVENSIAFLECEFSQNIATVAGGGVFVYSSSALDESVKNSSIQFNNCTWIKNSAYSIGAALEIIPLHLKNKVFDWFTEITLKNSRFSFNYFHKNVTNSQSVRSGIIYVTTVPVTFEGLLEFYNNTGDALDVVSAIVNFKSNSVVTFSNNNALVNGGALNLIGKSVISLNDNSNFTFSNNTACKGAAIHHHSTDPHDLIFSRSCFVKYAGSATDNIQRRKINFLFNDNAAKCKQFGSSIHATTFLPCEYANEDKTCKSNLFILDCVANFRFLGDHSNRTEVSTEPNKLIVTSKDDIIVAIPGKEVSLPIYVLDELNNTLSHEYAVSVLNTSGSVCLDKAYDSITSNTVKLHGKPGSNVTLHIAFKHTEYAIVETTLNLMLSQCPPGYVIYNKACKCSTFADDAQRYRCITECNEESNTALLTRNWWMNFDKANKSLNDEDRLIYGYCPKDHCYNNESFISLKVAEGNGSHLDDEYMCHPTRTGKLCSQCRDNYAAHYHSNTYKCGTRSTCRWGWLLYLISELLPVTCLFFIVIIFSIKLTSGRLNGLIYFAQTIDLIILDDVSSYFGTKNILLNAYSLVVRIFNLNFFQLDSMSYCLWETAQTLDMIAFRYVTTVYSFLLVVLIIMAVHYCNARCFKRAINKLHWNYRLTARNTLIHGIAGFLVLSYSKSISTSVSLLLSASMFTKGHKIQYSAVYYNGQLVHFGRQHLAYAIPAIFVLGTLGLFPPLLLIVYPLCYKILALLHLNESKFSRLLCSCFPLEKMKPLFDAFQSSFKDNYRFFSGLFFVFRLSTIVIQAIIPASGDTTYFFAAISIQSTTIFAIHALCQPYKNKWHNILEGLFLFDIAVIAMTFAIANAQTHRDRNMGLIVIQLVLLYFPLVIMAVYTAKVIYKKVKGCCKKKNEVDEGYREFNDSIIFQEAESRCND